MTDAKPLTGEELAQWEGDFDRGEYSPWGASMLGRLLATIAERDKIIKWLEDRRSLDTKTISELAAEIETLRMDLTHMKGDFDEMEAACEERDKTIGRLQETIQAQSRECVRRAKKIAELKRVSGDFGEDIDNLEKEGREYRYKIAEQAGEIGRLKEEADKWFKHAALMERRNP